MNPYVAQGMRCGHIDGKRRNSVYVIGEELLVDVADQGYGTHEQTLFQFGYEKGYRLGADGSELPADVINAPPPST